MKAQSILLICCAGLSVLLATGCGLNSGPSLADFNDNNIKKLRGAYGMYLVAHNLQGPKSEQDFKEFLTTSPSAIARMAKMGVSEDKILDIFISERDGQPFKVRYGLQGLADYPIIFEAEGVDNKRFVAFSTPRELGPEEYEAAWSGGSDSQGGMSQVREASHTP